MSCTSLWMTQQGFLDESSQKRVKLVWKELTCKSCAGDLLMLLLFWPPRVWLVLYFGAGFALLVLILGLWNTCALTPGLCFDYCSLYLALLTCLTPFKTGKPLIGRVLSFGNNVCANWCPSSRAGQWIPLLFCSWPFSEISPVLQNGPSESGDSAKIELLKRVSRDKCKILFLYLPSLPRPWFLFYL